MAIRITRREYFSELSTDGVPHLLGTKYAKIRFELEFDVTDIIQATSSRRLGFADPSQATNDYISSLDNYPHFQNLQEGDTYTITGTASNNITVVIIDKVSDYLVRTDTILTIESSLVGRMEFETPIEGIRYYFGLIENNEAINFNSKIDGSAQKWVVEQYPTGAQPITNMIYEGSIESKIGSATIERTAIGTASGNQTFLIKHTMFVDPVTIASQYANQVNGIFPPWSINDKSLKHAFQLHVSDDLSDPNRIQKIPVSDILGNFGWFGEKFNQGVNNYFVDSVSYKRVVGAVSIPGLELTEDEIQIDIIVKNTIDSPFSNNNTQFVADFSYCPQFDTEYKANGKNVVENFYFDRALQKVGSVAVNGDNFGTDQQVFKEITSSFIAANEIKITIITDMSAVMVADILTRTRKSFNLGIQIQNHTKQTAVADLVTLDVATEPFFIDGEDPTLLSITNNYLRHYELDPLTEGTTTPCPKSEDDALMYSLFAIDRNGREADAISVSNVKCQIVAKKTTGEEFVIEEFVKSFSTAQLIGDGVNNNEYDTQYIDYDLSRPFKMPNGDPRRTIEVTRRVDLDTADLRYYEVYYPFIIGYENWLPLPGVHADFFDVTEPQNGQNQNWYRYSSDINWEVVYRFSVNVVKNGDILPAFVEETVLEIGTYKDNPEWINEKITFKDTLGNILGVDDNGFLVTYEQYTTIEIEKTWNGATAQPILGDVEWWAHIQPFEGTGEDSIRPLSTVYDWIQNSWLRSSDGSNLVVKSVSLLVYKATFRVQSSLLPLGQKFDVSGRIFETNPIIIPVGAKLMEDGTVKLMEDGTTKLVDP